MQFAALSAVDVDRHVVQSPFSALAGETRGLCLRRRSSSLILLAMAASRGRGVLWGCIITSVIALLFAWQGVVNSRKPVPRYRPNDPVATYQPAGIGNGYENPAPGNDGSYDCPPGGGPIAVPPGDPGGLDDDGDGIGCE
jgi:hypothetical protein